MRVELFEVVVASFDHPFDVVLCVMAEDGICDIRSSIIVVKGSEGNSDNHVNLSKTTIVVIIIVATVKGRHF